MLLGYNTNGFAHHRLEDCLDILADLGCQSIALTLDYHALNPYEQEVFKIAHVRSILEQRRLEAVIETGARFLLDPRNKHQPTLLDPDGSARARRRDFIQRAIRLAAELGAKVVSLWSGACPVIEAQQNLLARLADECRWLADAAADQAVKLAFEPEPGMFIATLADFSRLEAQVRHPAFGLTMDIGHLHCQYEDPIPARIAEWRHVLWNVHIEDMRRNIHEHLPFGEGEIDFPPILQALRNNSYRGGLHIELSRHSHDAVNTARKSLAQLKDWLATLPAQ